MNINTLIEKGSKILRESDVLSYKIDSELLLSKVINKDRIFLITNGKHKVSSKKIKNYFEKIYRRQKKEPLAYILGKKEFYSLDFEVNNNVLVPRPDSEIIVEQVLKKYTEKTCLKILDIGTGSGCLLLSILKKLNKSYGTGIDKSIKALNIAKNNSKKHNLLNRTRFVNCDVDNFNFGNYDVIVSNPPYICSHKINDLSEDIRRFEPKMALDGGSTGLNVVNKVIVNAVRLLKTNGYLFLEIGSDQITKVSRILMQNKFKIARIQNDYANNIRCIISTRLI